MRAELETQLDAGLAHWDLLALAGSLDASGDPILLVVMTDRPPVADRSRGAARARTRELIASLDKRQRVSD